MVGPLTNTTESLWGMCIKRRGESTSNLPRNPSFGAQFCEVQEHN
ncbi:hypothetical protein L917_11975, partial [Phytophthora nicotianae]